MLVTVIISAVLAVSAFAVLFVGLGESGNLLILHFDIFKGINFLGSRGQLFGVFGSVLFIAVLNFVLASVFYKRNRFLAHLFAWADVFLLGLILIYFIAIISVN